jgi:hypothetical protein
MAETVYNSDKLLSYEMWIHIASMLEFHDVVSLTCAVSSRSSRLFLEDESFYRILYLRDFGELKLPTVADKSWKFLYINMFHFRKQLRLEIKHCLGLETLDYASLEFYLPLTVHKILYLPEIDDFQDIAFVMKVKTLDVHCVSGSITDGIHIFQESEGEKIADLDYYQIKFRKQAMQRRLMIDFDPEIEPSHLTHPVDGKDLVFVKDGVYAWINTENVDTCHYHKILPVERVRLMFQTQVTELIGVATSMLRDIGRKYQDKLLMRYEISDPDKIEKYGADVWKAFVGKIEEADLIVEYAGRSGDHQQYFDLVLARNPVLNIDTKCMSPNCKRRVQGIPELQIMNMDDTEITQRLFCNKHRRPVYNIEELVKSRIRTRYYELLHSLDGGSDAISRCRLAKVLNFKVFDASDVLTWVKAGTETPDHILVPVSSSYGQMASLRSPTYIDLVASFNRTRTPASDFSFKRIWMSVRQLDDANSYKDIVVESL